MDSMEPQRNATFYIETFGCQMNERDSETIAALLKERSMAATDDPKAADVIVLNTCAVRETAESKVWSRLGKIASMRRGGQMPVIVLAGCMAQVPENLEHVKKRVPFVSVVAGPGSIDKIPALVNEAMERRRNSTRKEGAMSRPSGTVLAAVSPPRTVAAREESTQVLPEGLPRSEVPGVTAYVTVMYGCDNFCSYCIVPFVRGPQVSRPRDAIVTEVERLARRGYKEVTLLGQNVNAYGHDLGDEDGFSDLLLSLNKVSGIERIRYFTSHPRDFTRKMVDTVRECEKVCEHFHLPLQSGSDRVLKAMNRGYTRDQYMTLVEYVKSTVPGASITTDIIVGFPGEAEEDFLDTLDIVKRAGFDGAFTFIFSPRKGTAAAKMKGQVPRPEKSARMQRLVDVQAEITRANNRALLGQKVEILVEGPDSQEPGAFRGRTRSNKMVVAVAEQGQAHGDISGSIKTQDVHPGDLVTVSVREAGTWYVKGPVAL